MSELTQHDNTTTTRGQGSTHEESVTTSQGEQHGMSELGQHDNTTTTRGQGSTHEESITASQGEQHNMSELGQHNNTTTTRGQGSEFMITSPEEPLALSTITITPGNGESWRDLATAKLIRFCIMYILGESYNCFIIIL